MRSAARLGFTELQRSDAKPFVLLAGWIDRRQGPILRARPEGNEPQANHGWLKGRDDMSLEIAMALREEAGKAREVADRVSNPDDKKALVQVAARLVQIAERLERDARD